MRLSLPRSASLLAVASAALSAHAVEAYSNFDGNPYKPTGPLLFSQQSFGYQFTSGATGILSGFSLAVNNSDRSGPAAYTLRLYSNTATNELGSELGVFSGLSTGENYSATTSALSVVDASSASLLLTNGTKYWLVAETTNSLVWNHVDPTAFQPTYLVFNGVPQYGNFPGSAFSVDVTAVPAPAAVLPFALGLIATRRRKWAA